MSIVIIKYNAGNIFSVESALHRLGADVIVTDDKKIIQQADKIIFPGVGEASTTMKHLRETGLDSVVKEATQPLLGICLGMQLMCRKSEEGDAECLNIFDVDVLRFMPQSVDQKVPHMGWNTISDVKSPLFKAEQENKHVYFVHSYYVPLNSDTAASTEYILPFSAALAKNNFHATQFHPEKSGDTGEQILKNFLLV